MEGVVPVMRVFVFEFNFESSQSKKKKRIVFLLTPKNAEQLYVILNGVTICFTVHRTHGLLAFAANPLQAVLLKCVVHV